MVDNSHPNIGRFDIREARLLYEEIREAADAVTNMLTLQGKPPFPPMIAAISNIMVLCSHLEGIARAKGLTTNAARLIQEHRHKECGLDGDCGFFSENDPGSELKPDIRNCKLAGEVIALYGLTEPLP